MVMLRGVLQAAIARITLSLYSNRMSMRYATLVVPVLVASAMNAQDYLANEPVWQVHSLCAVPLPCIASDHYNYYTVGDSVIDGTTWTKVERVGTVTLNWQSSPPVGPGCSGTTSYPASFYGTKLIRQDGRQLRIWADDLDQLLYDFDLVLGSTLPLSWNNWNTDITVIGVDSVLIGTEMRARYELGNSWAQYLVEGVGSSNGLFEPVSNFLECGYGLDCFGLGAEAFYPVQGGSCWLAMSAPESSRKSVVSLVPNPAEQVFTVTGSGTPLQQVVLRDMSGRIVFQERTTATALTVDVSALPAGCYAVSAGDATPLRLLVAH